MKKPQPAIACGDLICCNLTGIEGVVTSIRVLLNGCVQFAIQPKDPEKKTIVDAFFIDWQTAVLLKSQAIPRELPPEQFLFVTDVPAVEANTKVPGVGRGGPSVRIPSQKA